MSTSTSQALTPQRKRALERANQVRLARAELKRRIATGELFAASVILDPPQEARTMRVADVIRAQRGWGASDPKYRTRTRKLLSRLYVPETKPLGALTNRQRKLLAQALGQGVER